MRNRTLLFAAFAVFLAGCSSGGGGGSSTPTPTPTPTPTATPTPTPNFALHFDGVDDFAVFTDDGAFDFTNALTFEAWVKPSGPVGSLDAVVNGALSEPPAYTGAAWAFNPIDLTISVPSTDSTSAPATTDATWVHIAGTYDGITMSIYQNGVLAGSKMHASGGNTTGIGFLALGTLSTNYFSGDLDELRIWNVVRTPAQILANYNKASTGLEPGLIGYWKFDEGNGQTAASIAGGAHSFRLGTTTGAEATDPTWITSDVPLVP